MIQKLEVYDANCPHHCTKGILFHPRTHQMVRCPHCAKLRQEAVYSMDAQCDGGSIESKLGLQERVVGKTEYSFESIFRRGTSLLESDSLSDVKEQLDSLISGLSLGELPKYSMLFNLGARVYEENFVNPILIRAYLGGIDTAPLQTVYSIAKMRRSAESQNYSDDKEISDYERCLEASLCVVVLDEGITRYGIDSVEGFVAQRGRVHKPTILLTLSTDSEILYNFATSEGDYDYSTPKLVTVRYKKQGSYAEEKAKKVEEKSKEDFSAVSSAPQMSMSDLSMLTSSTSFM